MKRLLLITMLFVAVFASAQDYAFLSTMKDLKTAGDARAVADSLALHLKGKFRWYKTKEFDQGFLRIVFVPENMTEDEIKEQSDYEGSFVADFVVVMTDGVKTYRFDKAKAKYDSVFPVWLHFFKADAKPDKKVQRLTNQEKGIVYGFSSRGDVWVISR
jgi:hypothetical protein